MSTSNWNEYWVSFEREWEEKDPGGLQRKRDALREEQRTVSKTISMLMEGIKKWEERYYQIDAEIGEIDAEKDKLRDAHIREISQGVAR